MVAEAESDARELAARDLTIPRSMSNFYAVIDALNPLLAWARNKGYTQQVGETLLKQQIEEREKLVMPRRLAEIKNKQLQEQKKTEHAWGLVEKHLFPTLNGEAVSWNTTVKDGQSKYAEPIRDLVRRAFCEIQRKVGEDFEQWLHDDYDGREKAYSVDRSEFNGSYETKKQRFFTFRIGLKWKVRME